MASSRRSFASLGAASDEDTRSRCSWRRVSASAGAWAKPAACFTAWAVYPSTSSRAAAASRSVSSVMYVFLIHSAVSDRTCSRRRFSFTDATNRLASAGWARGSAAPGGRSRITAARTKAARHTRRAA